MGKQYPLYWNVLRTQKRQLVHQGSLVWVLDARFHRQKYETVTKGQITELHWLMFEGMQYFSHAISQLIIIFTAHPWRGWTAKQMSMWTSKLYLLLCFIFNRLKSFVYILYICALTHYWVLNSLKGCALQPDCLCLFALGAWVAGTQTGWWLSIRPVCFFSLPHLTDINASVRGREQTWAG